MGIQFSQEGWKVFDGGGLDGGRTVGFSGGG
jgi:hypothetical protein